MPQQTWSSMCHICSLWWPWPCPGSPFQPTTSSWRQVSQSLCVCVNRSVHRDNSSPSLCRPASAPAATLQQDKLSLGSHVDVPSTNRMACGHMSVLCGAAVTSFGTLLSPAVKWQGVRVVIPVSWQRVGFWLNGLNCTTCQSTCVFLLRMIRWETCLYDIIYTYCSGWTCWIWPRSQRSEPQLLFNPYML